MQDWINWFRHASPYINQHRNRSMVFGVCGEAIEHKNFINIVHDIALLCSLGIRVVLVLGARPQIDRNLMSRGLSSVVEENLRVTSKEALPSVLEAYGKVRSEVEALLSIGLVNSPMHGSSIKVVSGNFISAKPMGVLNGIDYGWTGKVRKVDSESINGHLKSGALVLQTGHGYAVTGEIFNLSYEELATDIAVALNAEKLIMLGSDKAIDDGAGETCRQITPDVAQSLVSSTSDDDNARLLALAQRACDLGVKRTHLLSYASDGAILEELFTRDGIGTMVSAESYDEVRAATLDDLNGIQELIQPLEEQGILVRRSREVLETELDAFTVNVRDNAIIACAALYSYPEVGCAELSCFAVDPEYRKEGRGDYMLEEITNQAKAQNLEYLFVLTTQTEHWFLERGFEMSAYSELPDSKQYDVSRKAKVLRKKLK
ncbi:MULTISPECIES: amino-acid N-acetyltransferase [unclassified Oleiphilus]|uniref:amino-acid N-acetyltransferase n=1 Tax=unclassified Oleiphilus TaxID=2631174 RepID=UPI0007C3A1F0|nr:MULTISPECIES: amino-acid N-acetyltransferase [unclassified Oleiphilus]KZY67898.1 amino-acid N-acetyltransferase [Oleiphilus sp. HI0066]KZY77427.1 amino-acid N-acetyltransferase [Oleiphilus sp. HI0067]